jgi:DNA-binding NarL/FixJ family response regulator
MDLINAGINGYVMKTTGYDELSHAIETLYAGGNYFSQEVTSLIIDTIRHEMHEPGVKRGELFSDKELKIIKLICEEKSTKEIADQMDINIRTLESVKIRLMKKIGVKNLAGLVFYALKHHYVDTDDLAAI